MAASRARYEQSNPSRRQLLKNVDLSLSRAPIAVFIHTYNGQSWTRFSFPIQIGQIREYTLQLHTYIYKLRKCFSAQPATSHSRPPRRTESRYSNRGCGSGTLNAPPPTDRVESSRVESVDFHFSLFLFLFRFCYVIISARTYVGIICTRTYRHGDMRNGPRCGD